MTLESQRNKSAFNPQMWGDRAKGGYENLGWVSASGPLEKIVEMAELKGDETIVDVGTGTQAVLDVLLPKIPNGKALGFDISREMIRRNSTNSSKKILFQADTLAVPLPNDFADLATIRMVLHHIEKIPQTLEEIRRFTKPGGKILAGEYVEVDEDVKAFERIVFDIKEEGRHLWTGSEFRDLIRNNWNVSLNNNNVNLGYGLIPQYSVRDWMGKSGKSQEIQTSVLNLYLSAPDLIIEKMNITFTEDGDALVDRPFAFVTAIK